MAEAPPHRSDSSEQRDAETAILVVLERVLGVAFDDPARLPADLGVRPDAVAAEGKIVVEVYARVGPLRGAQYHKVKGDILKLALIGARLGDGWRKILCFASEEAAAYVRGRSWVADAARQFGVEVVVVDVPAEVWRSVVEAQFRQRMVNPE